MTGAPTMSSSRALLVELVPHLLGRPAGEATVSQRMGPDLHTHGAQRPDLVVVDVLLSGVVQCDVEGAFERGGGQPLGQPQINVVAVIPARRDDRRGHKCSIASIQPNDHCDGAT